jgi:hypothetical protein
MTELARNHTPQEHAKPAVPAQPQPVSSTETHAGAAKADAKGEAATPARSDDKANPKDDDKVSAKVADQAHNGADAKTEAKGDQKTDAKSDAAPILALGNQAREVVSQVATQAKQAVSTRVAEQTDRGAGDLGDVAKALRKTSRQLDGNIASPLVDKAADQIERASEFLQTANPGQMAQAVQSFARREPLLFLGGAFAAGIVVARFLKSTSHREDDTSSEDHDHDGGDGEEHSTAPQAVAQRTAAPEPQAQQHQKRHGRKHRRR